MDLRTSAGQAPNLCSGIVMVKCPEMFERCPEMSGDVRLQYFGLKCPEMSGLMFGVMPRLIVYLCRDVLFRRFKM
jgi:hypothetical protein